LRRRSIAETERSSGLLKMPVPFMMHPIIYNITRAVSRILPTGKLWKQRKKTFWPKL